MGLNHSKAGLTFFMPLLRSKDLSKKELKNISIGHLGGGQGGTPVLGLGGGVWYAVVATPTSSGK